MPNACGPACNERPRLLRPQASQHGTGLDSLEDPGAGEWATGGKPLDGPHLPNTQVPLATCRLVRAWAVSAHERHSRAPTPHSYTKPTTSSDRNRFMVQNICKQHHGEGGHRVQACGGGASHKHWQEPQAQLRGPAQV